MNGNSKAPDQKAKGRLLLLCGVSDIIIGVGMACAALAGVLGEDVIVFVVVGAVIAMAGVGLALWGRNIISQVDDGQGRRRD